MDTEHETLNIETLFCCCLFAFIFTSMKLLHVQADIFFLLSAFWTLVMIRSLLLFFVFKKKKKKRGRCFTIRELPVFAIVFGLYKLSIK